MSIASEIERIQTNISDVYTTLEDRGIVVPATKDSSNLATAVANETTPIRIPTNCNGLTLWLDGDCNTRAGLDRSKKYMENIVHFSNLSNQVGSFEYVSANSSSNSWNNNFLLFKATYAGLLSNIFQNSAWTLEIVYRVFSSPTWSENTFNPYQGLGDNQGAALTVVWDGRTVLFYYSQGGSSLQSIGVPASMVTTEVTYYACYVGNGSTIRFKMFSPDYNATITNYERLTVDRNIGMFNAGGTPFTPGSVFSSNDKSAGIGMLRGWSRVLSDDEIQANYLDAKNRFGCA